MPRFTFSGDDLFKLIRFGLTGLANAVFSYGLFSLLYLAGVPPQAALVITYATSIAWNFMLHRRFVFSASGGLGRFPAYVGVYLGTYLVNSLLLGLAIRHGVSPMLAQALLTVLTAALAFVGISIVLEGRIPILNLTVWPGARR